MISVENYVKDYFTESPILAKIAECESHYRQFESDGSIFRGAMVREDIGVMQINETYHKVDAKELGFDIYTLDGNLAYAEYLYGKQGTQPWSASKFCWDR
jgi:hypothetical protein